MKIYGLVAYSFHSTWMYIISIVVRTFHKLIKKGWKIKPLSEMRSYSLTVVSDWVLWEPWKPSIHASAGFCGVVTRHLCNYSQLVISKQIYGFIIYSFGITECLYWFYPLSIIALLPNLNHLFILHLLKN